MTEFNNVDPADIARFTAMASRWWDPAGEMAPLHHINPARTQYIDKVCGGLAGQKVIDVGCGGGLLSEALARRGAEVTGIDLAEASIAVAREHAGASGLAIDYQCVATEAMAQRAPKSFDVVCCLEMLEHVPDPEAIIKACAELLRAVCPDAEIRIFAMIRTQGLQDDIEKIVDPSTGIIMGYPSGKTHRDP